MNDINQFFNTNFWEKIIELNDSPWRMAMSVLDIALVAYLIYSITKYVQGTKLMTLVRGVGLFVLAKIISSWLGLTTVEWLINQVITYGVIAGVVVFQPEIRRGLESLGRTTQLFSTNKKTASTAVLSYEKALRYMADRKIGALIAIEGNRSLGEYASTGIALDAVITEALLINIFVPNTPLHDGAVIIRNNRIAVTSAYLPLSERADISKIYGTRHRAAIGLSEVTDAVTLVVSEETGHISLTHNGEFYANLSDGDLHQQLVRLLDKDEKGAGI